MEENKKENDFNPLPNRLINLAGATATVSIIALILYLLNIIPENAENVSLTIGFFVSLPLVYSFIFGIILNRPNFSSVFRHYSFTAYLILALVIFMIVLRPTSITEGVRYSFQFLLGLVLAVIGYFFYAVGYKFSTKLKIERYRWRTIISFSISFLVTLTIAFILKHFNVFELI